MSAMVWVVVGFLLVAITKYLTAHRLRVLQERMQREHQNATDMKQVLEQVTEREGVLKEELGRVQTRLANMHNIVANLERVVQKGTAST